MKRLGAGLLMCSATALAGAAVPQAGQDYYSVQIASGGAAGLETTFRQHARLPYLRIERRGELHVLRAGFWRSGEEARAALSGTDAAQFLVRVAAFRPEAILRGNWEGAATPTTAVIPPASAAPVAVVATVPAHPAEPATTAVSLATAATRPAQPAQPASVPKAARTDDLRPFQAEDYALAFDVFMGAGDQQRAFLLAKKAVASVPDDLSWRRRLARLAEWTQKPDLAWEQREYLFRHGDRDEETLAAVLRLAPLAGAPEAALEVWEIRAARGALTEAQWDDMAELYELAARPRQGAAFFEQQFRARREPKLLERAATLADHAGDDETALRLYRERSRLAPYSLDATLHAVVFLLRRDRAREAYDLMQARREEVQETATEYWRILGQIAWELAELGTAEEAYRRITGSPRAVAPDWSRLIFLVRQHHPDQAADLAFEAYRRFGGTDYLLLAIGIHAERGDLKAQGRLFAALSAPQQTALEGDVRFLVVRGQYRQASRQMEPAWGDFRRALVLAPDNNEVVLPALWFLIDTRRKSELEPLLRTLAARAENDAAYWLPFAAAHHGLDRYREALGWYRKEITRSPEDALLLLNYADALERVHQAGMAARVRRHAWLRLRERHPRPEFATLLDKQPELLALARLAILDQPGDGGLGLVRAVVGHLRGLPAESNDTLQTRDLVLGWAIAKEQFPNARAWMWLQYARNAGTPPPAWGDSQTALQLNETESMDRLLSTRADSLPIYNRYDTAYALEHWPQALDIAFHGLENSDVDEDLYDRYRQHAPLHAAYLQARLSRDRFGVLDSHGRQFEARLIAQRKMHVRLGWSRLDQSSGDSGLAPFVPAVDRLGSIEFKWLGQRGDTTFALFHRDELGAGPGWRLDQNWAWSGRLALDGGIAQRAESTASIPLRVGGYERTLHGGLTYTLGKREYLRVAPRLSRYYTQYDDYLGHGQGLDLEAGYRIRTEYPDWRLRAFASSQRSTADGNVGERALARLAPETRDAIAAGSLDAARYFIPAGSTTWGVCLGMGENLAGQNLREVYTRAWRPFFDGCTSRNTANGVGYSGALGVAGSLEGNDHLVLQLEQSRGGSGSGALTRVFAIRYRHYF